MYIYTITHLTSGDSVQEAEAEEAAPMLAEHGRQAFGCGGRRGVGLGFFFSCF